MNLDRALLEIIVCPACHGRLTPDDQAEELQCDDCRRAYPVRNDIPVLLVEEARMTPSDR